MYVEYVHGINNNNNNNKHLIISRNIRFYSFLVIKLLNLKFKLNTPNIWLNINDLSTLNYFNLLYCER